MRAALAVLLLAGCGRSGFAAIGSDAADTVDAVPDATLVTPDANPLCAEGDAHRELEGSCYSRFDSPRTYLAAAAACETIDAHLVSLRTQNEADLIPLMVNQPSWVGLSDRDSPGTFVWLTGEPLTALRFPSSEPSGDGDCVETSTSGFWNDTDCATPKPYVCERVLAQPPCVEGDVNVEFGGHCYWRIANKVVYADAVAECLTAGGHPPVITSQAENDAALSIWTDWSWIALRDLPSPGTFEWDTGEPLGYTNWYPGEPSASGGIENCGHLWGSGEWNNSVCDAAIAHIMCERP